MKQILHQAVFPVVAPAKAPPSVFGSMEVPVKATAVAAAVACAATFNFFALPKQPAPFVLKTGFHTYDTPTKVVTFVGPELGYASRLFVAAATPTGWYTYDTPTKLRTFVTDPLPFQFKPPPPPTGWQTYDTPTKVRTFAGPELGQALFAPPKVTTPSGFQSYDTPTKVIAFVGPELGQSLFFFPPPPTPTGWYSYETPTKVRAFVTDPLPFEFTPPPPPTGWQSYDTPTKVAAFVGPELGQSVEQFVVTQLPTGFQTYDTPTKYRTFTDGFPFVTTTIANPTQALVFYHDQEYAFARPYPIAVHVELSPFLPPGINLPAPETGIPSGDGPPWHLTNKEIKRLLHYREELASLQKAYDLRHRENVERLLRDVEVAVYGEEEPAIEVVDNIEAGIKSLPALPKKSFFSLDVKALKGQVAKYQAEREVEADEEDVQMIIKAFYS